MSCSGVCSEPAVTAPSCGRCRRPRCLPIGRTWRSTGRASMAALLAVQASERLCPSHHSPSPQSTSVLLLAAVCGSVCVTVPSGWDANPNLVVRFQVSTVLSQRRRPRSVERTKNVCTKNHSQAGHESHQPRSCSQPDGPSSACWRLKRFGRSAEH